MVEKKKVSKYVIAVTSVSTSINDRKVFINQGEAFRSDDPVVKKFPSIFQDAAEYAAERGGLVEQATAGPGEVRNVAIPEKA